AASMATGVSSGADPLPLALRRRLRRLRGRPACRRRGVAAAGALPGDPAPPGPRNAVASPGARGGAPVVPAGARAREPRGALARGRARLVPGRRGRRRRLPRPGHRRAAAGTRVHPGGPPRPDVLADHGPPRARRLVRAPRLRRARRRARAPAAGAHARADGARAAL
ncbi:MAG: Acetyltransferase, GNAT family, partial [uncultured Solirubrobacteraceae bacterium]